MIKKLSQDYKNDFSTGSNTGFVGENFDQKGFQITFTVNDIPFQVPVIGKHNMENAIGATAVAAAAGVKIEEAANALKSYVGIYRRTQLVGEKKGIFVIDDFAHNPAEVAAAIKACQEVGSRVIAWFQPHGYGPLRFMHEELAEKVASTLREQDYFIMSDVYYAGGTVTKDISSDVVINDIANKGKKALLVEDRKKLLIEIQRFVRPGDVILLMGARDPSLADFALEIFSQL